MSLRIINYKGILLCTLRVRVTLRRLLGLQPCRPPPIRNHLMDKKGTYGNKIILTAHNM